MPIPRSNRFLFDRSLSLSAEAGADELTRLGTYSGKSHHNSGESIHPAERSDAGDVYHFRSEWFRSNKNSICGVTFISRFPSECK